MSFVPFIKNGSLIKEISKDYDVILSDFDFIDLDKNFVLLKDNFDTTISYYISKEKKILLILDKLHIESLLHIISHSNSICIINLNSGLYEKGNKIQESMFDITTLFSLNFDIYEPTDIQCLKNIINDTSNNKKFIRINNNELTEENFVGLDNLNSLHEKGYDGDVSTLLVFGTYWIELIKGLEENQELKKSFNVFVSNKINFILNEELIDNLKQTQNIFIILDMKNILLYENYIKNLFYTNKLYDIKINFILPKYNKLTTIIDEYRLEEVAFDWKNIIKRIIK